MFDSALRLGVWHAEYLKGVRPHTTGFGRRRCALPNTPADGPRHAQTRARRSASVPTTVTHPIPHPKKGRRGPQRAAEGRRGPQRAAEGRRGPQRAAEGRRGPQRRFRELRTRRAMYCGLRWRARGAMRKWRVAHGNSSSTAYCSWFVSPSKLAELFQPARRYQEACLRLCS